MIASVPKSMASVAASIIKSPAIRIIAGAVVEVVRMPFEQSVFMQGERKNAFEGCDELQPLLMVGVIRQ